MNEPSACISINNHNRSVKVIYKETGWEFSCRNLTTVVDLKYYEN
jgi:hypothetical protein